ncbi:homeodomain-interacting protein kinase 2-like isoform X2 [Hippocampus zosterae]|uniref:homeodomain-interacting protein kinase 2-like isoform X2 n=1 Tax=Hippocampus zosterae TaxID=109293 RepID=UPI00223D5A44|nr:homeodomain-interacting protein kinase 2-like isoform X2 [Hippocampus zosterae]
MDIPPPSEAAYRLRPGARLHSPFAGYKVLSVKGEGTFGKVAKCRKADTNKTVAVKMIRDQGNFAVQARFEIEALQKIQMLENYTSHLVQWMSTFSYMGYICLEFEYLDKSLFDFMKERHFKPLQVKEIRPIVHQLAKALDHLKGARMIHADLKLENIMFINHQQQPYRVKVIDFGLTHDIADARPGSSPEVLVGAPYDEAIDIWSMGCVTAFLYTGTLIFPGKNDYEMITYITGTQGAFPDSLLVSGKKTEHFFHQESETSLWSLKTSETYQQETGIAVRMAEKFQLSSLDHLLQLQQFQWCYTRHPSDQVVYSADKLMFVDMLKGMLRLDASLRMTPRQVLEHQFISMSHLWPHFAISPHVRFCCGIMAACDCKEPRGKKKEVFPQNLGSCVCNKKQSGQNKKSKDGGEAGQGITHPKKRKNDAGCQRRKNTCIADQLHVRRPADSVQPIQTWSKVSKNARQHLDVHAASETKSRVWLRKDTSRFKHWKKNARLSQPRPTSPAPDSNLLASIPQYRPLTPSPLKWNQMYGPMDVKMLRQLE